MEGEVKRYVCRECGKENKRGSRCPACYQRAYRATPEGKRHHNDAIIRYVKRNPEKHREWSRIWRERTGRSSPDLQATRKAVKRLERALANPSLTEGVRSPSERNGDGGDQRGDRR